MCVIRVVGCLVVYVCIYGGCVVCELGIYVLCICVYLWCSFS